MIAKAAAEVAERVGAKYLVAFTQCGDSARRLARYRGTIPVLAFTPEARVRSQLALTWGVETFKTDSVEHTDEMVRQVDEQLLKIGRVKEGDLVVIIAGAPRHPRLHQRAAHPPDGRRDQRGRPGVPPRSLTRIPQGRQLPRSTPSRLNLLRPSVRWPSCTASRWRRRRARPGAGTGAA